MEFLDDGGVDDEFLDKLGEIASVQGDHSLMETTVSEVEPWPRIRYVQVLLDIFHAMNRLTRTLKKSHGAFFSFMVVFRDCMMLVDDADYQNHS